MFNLKILFEKYRRIIIYVLVGGCTTLIDFTVCFVFFSLLHFDENVSNTIAIIMAIAFAYITNKIFVFESKNNGRKELIKEIFSFVSARFATMLLQIGGVFLFVSVLQFNIFIIKAALSVIVLIINYLVSKVLVFKTPKND